MKMTSHPWTINQKYHILNTPARLRSLADCIIAIKSVDTMHIMKIKSHD